LNLPFAVLSAIFSRGKKRSRQSAPHRNNLPLIEAKRF